MFGSIPISIHNYDPVYMRVSNNSLEPIIWQDAPLSTNHLSSLDTIPEREKTNKISLWNTSTTSKTSIVDVFFFLPLPLRCGHYEA
jgi:hypothetical protein